MTYQEQIEAFYAANLRFPVTTPAAMIAAAPAAGARCAAHDKGLGIRASRSQMIAWIRMYGRDIRALDELSQADRRRVYDAAWRAYQEAF